MTDLAASQLALADAISRQQDDPSVGLLVPGGSLDAAGAIAVYRGAYLARLTEQLGEVYESVWRVLGDEEFFTVCEQYIAAHRSSSYNLSDYGRDFAEFIEDTPAGVEWPMLGELSRFELAFHDVFHAAAHEPIGAASFATLDDLAGRRFRFGTAVRILSFTHAVYDVFRHRHDEQLPVLDLDRTQRVLMYKQGGEVLAREIDSATHAVLAALASGATIEAALSRGGDADAAFGPAAVTTIFELIARCGLVEAAGR